MLDEYIEKVRAAEAACVVQSDGRLRCGENGE